MAKTGEKSTASALKVCLLSPHPMVLDEFKRLLETSGFQIAAKQLDSMLAPDLRHLDVPKASVYVIDAHAARQATGALLGNILERNENARLIVVGDKLKESDSHSLLRQGVKGILTYRRGARPASPCATLSGCGRVLGTARSTIAICRCNIDDHPWAALARRRAQ